MPVSYFAYGLYESYIDKHRASHMNVFGTTWASCIRIIFVHRRMEVITIAISFRQVPLQSEENVFFPLALRNIRSGRLRKRDIIMRWRKLGKLWSAPITR